MKLGEAVLRRLEKWRFRRKIDRALALNVRAEVRSDGLGLVHLSNRLEIQWRARDIHPWDRGRAGRDCGPALLEQSLSDTEAAIIRLFDALPQVDVIDLTVLDPASDEVRLAGTVYRSTLQKARTLLSVRMRLNHLGITYRFPDAVLCSQTSDR
jgi:hypothetical protein